MFVRTGDNDRNRQIAVTFGSLLRTQLCLDSFILRCYRSHSMAWQPSRLVAMSRAAFVLSAALSSRPSATHCAGQAVLGRHVRIRPKTWKKYIYFRGAVLVQRVNFALLYFMLAAHRNGGILALAANIGRCVNSFI